MKFNPSPHVLKMRGLYDSRRELVEWELEWWRVEPHELRGE